MANLVKYDPQDHLIRIELHEKLDKSMIAILSSETALLAREHDCYLALTDAREASSGLSTLEIYGLPELIMEIFEETGISVYKFKRALVVDKNIDDFTFFETVSRNRGHNVTMFRNIDEAIEWLLAK